MIKDRILKYWENIYILWMVVIGFMISPLLNKAISPKGTAGIKDRDGTKSNKKENDQGKPGPAVSS